MKCVSQSNVVLGGKEVADEGVTVLAFKCVSLSNVVGGGTDEGITALDQKCASLSNVVTALAQTTESGSIVDSGGTEVANEDITAFARKCDSLSNVWAARRCRTSYCRIRMFVCS